jgi:hypothetical protein
VRAVVFSPLVFLFMGASLLSMCVKECCARQLNTTIFQLLQTHTQTHYTFFGNLVGMPTANCLESARSACKNVMKNCAAFTSLLLFRYFSGFMQAQSGLQLVFSFESAMQMAFLKYFLHYLNFTDKYFGSTKCCPLSKG